MLLRTATTAASSEAPAQQQRQLKRQRCTAAQQTTLHCELGPQQCVRCRWQRNKDNWWKDTRDLNLGNKSWLRARICKHSFEIGCYICGKHGGTSVWGQFKAASLPTLQKGCIVKHQDSPEHLRCLDAEGGSKHCTSQKTVPGIMASLIPPPYGAKTFHQACT